MSGRREAHTILISPAGEMTICDLTDDLLPLAAAPPPPLPSQLGEPRLPRSQAILLPLPADPAVLSEPELWRWHARGAALFRRGDQGRRGGVSWLAVKRELASRLLGPGCRLCARGCPVDRSAGEAGACGLTSQLHLAHTSRLWGEEEVLGRPGFACVTSGCGLRCRFCYRWDQLPAAAGQVTAPADLAAEIDAAAGVTHVHWLGGNPDEQLPAILAVHAACTRPRPVVWNTHSYLTAPGALLLEGVVDAVIGDLKFGPGDCGAALAGVAGYWPAATASLARLARFDLKLIVRHLVVPGHLACCTAPVAEWVGRHLPGAELHLLDQYQPCGPAASDPGPTGRLLGEEERAAVRTIQSEMRET